MAKVSDNPVAQLNEDRAKEIGRAYARANLAMTKFAKVFAEGYAEEMAAAEAADELDCTDGVTPEEAHGSKEAFWPTGQLEKPDRPTKGE